MLSSTLEEGLRNYEIGEKVRALRLRKKMALVELGKHTGLSAALLSKIERSNIYPPLPTLLRIAMVFGVGLDYFFRDESKRVVSIVRRSERQRFPDKPDGGPVSFWFESLDFAASERKMSAYYAEFQPVQPEGAATHAHDGAECIYVLTGRLGLTIGRQEHELDEGDAVYFDSSVPHSYRRLGRNRCAAMVVTARG
jgi:transcriptional regulator with XRE-family HTH domain